jgi:hypothetical protein
MKLARHSFFVPLAALLLASHARGDGREAEHRSGYDSAAVVAKDPYDAARQFRMLFEGASARELADMQVAPQDSIAIQAAWQVVNLTVPVQPYEGGLEKAYRPDRDKLNRFIGFLEGRTHARIPKWWADSLLDARANKRGNIYFPSVGGDPPKEPMPAGVTKRNNEFVLAVGGDSIVVPAKLITHLLEHKFIPQFERMSGVFTPKSCYVAIYDDAGYPYTVACIDRTAVRVVWKSEGWGSWWGAVQGGVAKSRVSVELQGDRVLVFGVSGIDLIHAEAFRADNGENLWRFSNTYCE